MQIRLFPYNNITYFMSNCTFCHEPGHRIQQCNSPLISLFETCIRYNAAYDYYLGLETTYLQLYLNSLNVNLLRAIGYTHNIVLKQNSFTSKYRICIPYNRFIKQFLIHYLHVPSSQHIELINSLSYGKIVIYSHHIHDLFLRNNIHTNWTPVAISTILMSTRIFSIELKVIQENDVLPQLDECAICFEEISQDKHCKLLCNHYFCSSCLFQYIETLYKSNRDNSACPLCRNNITDIMVPKSNYYNCLYSISKIKNIYKENRIRYDINDNEDNDDDIEPFESRMEYFPIFVSEHPPLKQMKYVFYIVMRMFIIFTYFEYLFETFRSLFKNANSSHNPNMLQI